MAKSKKGISVQCETDFWVRFKAMANADGNRSVASMIRKLMEEAVARYEQSAG